MVGFEPTSPVTHPGASSRLSHLLAPRWLIATRRRSSSSLVLPYSVQSTHRNCTIQVPYVFRNLEPPVGIEPTFADYVGKT